MRLDGWTAPGNKKCARTFLLLLDRRTPTKLHHRCDGSRTLNRGGRSANLEGRRGAERKREAECPHVSSLVFGNVAEAEDSDPGAPANLDTLTGLINRLV